MKLTRFEDLAVWQRAMSLAAEIYAASKDGEFGRDFGLRDQIRRAAVSIASNVAEGKERETVPELIRHLYIAKGSAGELKTQLMIAERIGYLHAEQARSLVNDVAGISAMLGALIRGLKGQSRQSG
jgi:four helix bundle protein